MWFSKTNYDEFWNNNNKNTQLKTVMNRFCLMMMIVLNEEMASKKLTAFVCTSCIVIFNVALLNEWLVVH